MAITVDITALPVMLQLLRNLDLGLAGLSATNQAILQIRGKLNGIRKNPKVVDAPVFEGLLDRAAALSQGFDLKGNGASRPNEYVAALPGIIGHLKNALATLVKRQTPNGDVSTASSSDVAKLFKEAAGSVNAFWQERIRHFNAVPRKYGKESEEQKDKAIYFETRNFGWILSPIDPTTGYRTVLLQY